MKRRVHLTLLALLTASCAAAITLVSFQVTRDPNEDPFPGATDVEVSVRQDGVLLPRLTERTPLDRAPFGTPTVPFGVGYSLRVDVLDGDLLLARGTSTRFAVAQGEAPALPDVFVAPLGRFAEVATRSAPEATHAARVDEQVLIGNADGSVWALDLHDGATSERWAAGGGREMSPLSGALLVLAGSEARVFDAEDHLLDDPALGRHGADAVLVAALEDDGATPCAYVLGGRTTPTAVSRICLTAGALALSVLGDLGVGGWGGAGAYVPLVGGGARIAWVGRDSASGPSTSLTLVDPAAPQDVATVALDLPATGGVVIAHGTGELLVVGGRSGTGVLLADVARVVLQPGAAPPAVRAAPAPEPLFAPREGARSSVVADGVYLIYGGVGAGGAAATRAELVDVRSFPGTVAPTGTLPANDPVVVVPLEDHAQLAVGATGLWRYASPRGYR